MKSSLTSHRADYVGITGSVLCLIHCLITPVLLVTSSLLKNDVVRTSYLSLDYIFIGVNIVAVFFATRHAPVGVRRALWGFLGLFAVCIILEDVSELFEYAAYVASLGLVGSHLYNIWNCRTQHSH
ncbi:MerC domain-containing protein [Rudanella lutea]|uniref:MerC domain-containing protein n=1 Tax=Rudanella lutea TaxID=451374 RepID=UPI00035F8F2D|nr:MerC domain-containing protein [Rudanella lutea]